jgi:cytochrome c-type biogenesis protein CcmH/NrfF
MLVWALPVGAFLLGAGGLALALRRWRSEPRLAASTADEQLVRRTREVP